MNRYSDTCPACGSSEVTPYAVIVGGSEEYGYHCLVCQVTWPVLAHHDPVPAVAAVSLRNRVVREGLAARGSVSISSSHANDSQPASRG